MTHNAEKIIPKVPRLKVLSNLLSLLKNPIDVFSQYFNKYGDTFKISQSEVDIIFTQRTEVVEYVLQKNNRNYWKPKRAKKLLGEYLGNGLLLSDGDYWLQQRRLIQPGFKKSNLAQFVKLMQTEVDNYDSKFEKLAKSNEVFDITHDMMGVTFRIIASCISTVTYDEKALARIEHIEVEILKYIAKTGRLPFLKSWFRFTGEDDRIKKLSNEGNDLLYKVIDERIASREEHDDILDMLLNIRYEDTNKGMTRKQLLDELLILIVAGHETTANALSWTLYLLAEHPEVEAQILQEIKEVLGNEKPSLENLPKLEYTKMVLQESMRLHPPAWITDRVALEDDEIDGIEIPKNSIVTLFIYGIHRNPKYWDNPDKFIPTRFSKANMKGRKKFTYLPFGGGPRLCIGNNFAMMEMQLTLVHLLRKYKWTLVKDQKIVYQPLITLRPRYGIKMQITERNISSITESQTTVKGEEKESKCPFH
ncbi:MAG: cytochrome P450 [Maribacter sp.]|jgi:cytochrome P450